MKIGKTIPGLLKIFVFYLAINALFLTSQVSFAEDIDPVANLVLSPGSSTVSIGDEFQIEIIVECNGQNISGVASNIDYNPLVLQVVNITVNETSPLETVIENVFDNEVGTFDFTAVTMGNTYPSETFTAATITFSAIAENPSSDIVFHQEGVRRCYVDYLGTSTLNVSTGAIVEVGDRCPTANDDQGQTDEDSKATIDALGNDSNDDGDTISIDSYDTTSAKGGSVTKKSDGTFEYDPKGKFESLQVGHSDSDSFTYTITDGKCESTPATVSITISGVNDAPVAVDDIRALSGEEQNTNFIPIVNDTDIDGDALAIHEIDDSSTMGEVTILSAELGKLGYDTNGKFQYLSEGQQTTDSVVYTITDGNAGYDSATLTISITGENDPPVAEDDTARCDENGSFVIDVLANDSDPDQNDVLRILSVTHGDNGASVTNNGKNVTYEPAQGFAGEDQFEYTITDDNEGYDSATVTVIVSSSEKIVYVDVDATGDNTGTSWVDAFNDLQDGLEAASAGDEIWVAEGTYFPSVLSEPDDPRTAHFKLKNEVAVYGGFIGNESSFEQRDWEVNRTTLSGDIGIADDDADNSYHVFFHNDDYVLDQTAILDGFVVKGGNANKNSHPHWEGGGMLNRISASPRLENCIFISNRSETGGAAINNYGSYPSVTNCKLIENVSVNGSGGVKYHGSADFYPIIKGCIFRGNHGNHGGGFYAYGVHTTIDNCVFENNTANAGGGAYFYKASSRIDNCTFFDNSSTTREGGAIGLCCGSTIQISNCTFDSNESNAGGKAIGSDSAIICEMQLDISIINSVLWDGEGEIAVRHEDVFPTYIDVQYSNIFGGFSGKGNIEKDPLFFEAENGDLRLKSGSPLIDAGDNTALPSDFTDLDNDGDTTETLPLDLDGNPRRIDDIGTADTGNGNSPIVDMGAYEFSINYPPVPVNDEYSVENGGTLAVPSPGVLGNDTDAENDPVFVIEIDGNSVNVGQAVLLVNGTATVNADGSLEYVHDGLGNGGDAFTYRINDGNQDSQTEGTVAIEMTTPPGQPIRTLPEMVLPGETFEVSIEFAAPGDGFNGIGLTDIAPGNPTAWPVSFQKEWCTPETDFFEVDGGSIELIWSGAYNQGQAVTAVYNVTVPSDATEGTYYFEHGTLEYYLEAEGPFFATVSGDDSVEIVTGALIEGVTGQINCEILEGVSVSVQNGASALSDADGNYEILATGLGDQILTASKSGFRNVSLSIDIDDLKQSYILDFIAPTGLIPNAPDISYVLSCINKWKYGEGRCALSISDILAVINAWKYPVIKSMPRTAAKRLPTGAKPLRDLPDIATPRQSFQVTVVFTAPDDGFNAIGLTDLAPAGWTVAAESEWSSPEANQVSISENQVQLIWYGDYTAGQQITAVYAITPPCEIDSGDWLFQAGVLEYYLGAQGPVTETVGGDETIVIGSSACTGDFNEDGLVNFIDLGLFADQWLFRDDDQAWDAVYNIFYDCAAGNQIIDYLDLAVFGDHWMTACE